MKTVTIHEAKTHLSKLIHQVERGESIVIARGSEPVAELRAIRRPKQVRAIGDWKGRIRIADDFDAPLDDFGTYR